MAIIYKRLGAEEIDGAGNAVDTDISLYTMGASLSGIANIMAFNKSANPAAIRMAVIENGAIGAVSEEDYYWKEDVLPAGGRLYELAVGMNEGDTILVRCDIEDVNFIATGMEQDK